MKTIDVQSQPILGFGRVAGLALSGVRYRLFRAAVTVCVIAVAMAFLSNILTESLIKGAVATRAREGIRDLRVAEAWIANLSVPLQASALVQRLASDAPANAPRLREAAALAATPPEALDALVPLARQAQAYLAFFDGLEYGRRRILVGSAEGPAIFNALVADPAGLPRLFDGLQAMKAFRFPTDRSAFESFLKQWPQLQTWIEQVRAGQAGAIRKIESHLGERSLLSALSDVEGEFGAVLADAGFPLEPAERTLLASRARDAHHAALAEAALAEFEVRQQIAARRDILPSDVTPLLLWDLLRAPEDAEWLLGVMQRRGRPTGELDRDGLVRLAEQKARERLMMEAELATADAGGGFLGLGRRMTWLAFVSMLVCVVGIANAMLMSVTERFREIATLKCLGALDGFIMTVFLIEAAVLGLAGGIAGAIAGVLLGVGRMFLHFRSLLLESMPTGQLLTAMLISVGVGVLLAAVAAVYPSLRAAQLAPMEAMRIE